MILFTFEWKKYEEYIYSTIKQIFKLKDDKIYHYGTTIYGLYKKCFSDDYFDLIRFISEKNKSQRKS